MTVSRCDPLKFPHVARVGFEIWRKMDQMVQIKNYFMKQYYVHTETNPTCCQAEFVEHYRNCPIVTIHASVQASCPWRSSSKEPKATPPSSGYSSVTPAQPPSSEHPPPDPTYRKPAWRPAPSLPLSVAITTVTGDKCMMVLPDLFFFYVRECKGGGYKKERITDNLLFIFVYVG